MHSFPDGIPWRTSSYTLQENCVEVSDIPGTSAVRDTKSREGAVLKFPSLEWRALVEAAKSDEF